MAAMMPFHAEKYRLSSGKCMQRRPAPAASIRLLLCIRQQPAINSVYSS